MEKNRSQRPGSYINESGTELRTRFAEGREKSYVDWREDIIALRSCTHGTASCKPLDVRE
ncbi:hypothetical protein ARMGADRAFT_1014111 [Armillaria gallica]|uniref:Uncharacterized protein n=1 Tax=Armillaria gallica TaxID=47427 RepID=A0A2H3DD44_ARMGA|nr:hypothetical protein ARMGADRAFT_1014111 [Armillaria gallica]